MTREQVHQIKMCFDESGLVQYLSSSDDHNGFKFNIVCIAEEEGKTIAFLENISEYIVLEEEKFEDFSLFK